MVEDGNLNSTNRRSKVMGRGGEELRSEMENWRTSGNGGCSYSIWECGYRQSNEG